MNAAIATGMNLHVASGTDTCLDAGTKVHVKAGVNLVLEAGVMISLKVGGSSITIGPAGVTLDGPLVRINCGGSPLAAMRSEEHTSELQSLMRISYAVFCLKKKTNTQQNKE